MMGRRNQDQGHLFYSFDLDAVVPGDHLVREIAAVLDLTWVHDELAPHYPAIGRPSSSPEAGNGAEGAGGAPGPREIVDTNRPRGT